MTEQRPASAIPPADPRVPFHSRIEQAAAELDAAVAAARRAGHPLTPEQAARIKAIIG